MRYTDAINIEQTLLSSLVSNKELIEDCSELESLDFIPIAHQEIFKLIRKMHQNNLPMDEDVIIKELKGKYEDELLVVLSKNPASNIEYYVAQVKEYKEKRELKRLLVELEEDLQDEILDFAQMKLKLQNAFSGKNYNSKRLTPTSSKDIEAKAPEFYLEDSCPIQKYETTLFTSSGGVGKSFTLLKLLLELQNSNVNCLGWFSEDSASNTKYRMEILKEKNKHLKDIEIDIMDKACRPQPFLQIGKNRQLEVAQFFYEFKMIAKPYDVILLDPLDSFIAIDENSNTEARYLMNLLSEWLEEERKTLLIIHHHNKEGGARGATAFINAVRIHYEVISDKKQPQSRFIQTKKANHIQDKKMYEIEMFQQESEPLKADASTAQKSDFVAISSDGTEVNLDDIEGANDYILLDDEIEVTKEDEAMFKALEERFGIHVVE
ncbi:DnaB-like helicase N-terminal domain-containing protein [Sulfurimonas indica]|uniref:DnaB-like helicase N-terminal domain-containing protein n=1 Tax=Sulfurimonas TaxID=202746 RepID=UPI00126427D9|nr:DnaB-like helicase N-terminal domain-containing protein [Sulfurimonas indica]